MVERFCKGFGPESIESIKQALRASAINGNILKNTINSSIWALMPLPDKLKVLLAYGTNKTMPIATLIIICIAMILRSRYSATLDVYEAQREAAIKQVTTPIDVECEGILTNETKVLEKSADSFDVSEYTATSNNTEQRLDNKRQKMDIF